MIMHSHVFLCKQVQARWRGTGPACPAGTSRTRPGVSAPSRTSRTRPGVSAPVPDISHPFRRVRTRPVSLHQSRDVCLPCAGARDAGGNHAGGLLLQRSGLGRRHIGEPAWGGWVASGMMSGAERRPPMAGGRRRSRVCCALIGMAAVAAAVVGCGASGASPGGKTPPAVARTDNAVTSCGTTKTAANVPVRIHVQRGPATCKTAMIVERDYAKAIMAGRAPGNGGGGPVMINGWTCQGFATPVVLRTGKASKRVKGTAEILAVLPAPA